MKTDIQKKRFLSVFAIAILLSLASIYLLVNNFKLAEILKTQPFDLIVANITPTSAEIYWKIKEDDFQMLYFKTTDGEEEPISALSNTYAFTDNIKEANLYITQLTDLEPNQNYRFAILSTKTGKVWDIDYSFKTKDSGEKADDIVLPSIEVGESNIDKLVLFTFENGEKLITDTVDHGTWVIDAQEKKYTVEDYAQITPEKELVARLNRKLVSSVYAADVTNPKIGANCQTNITIKTSQTYGLTKGKFTGHPTEGWEGACRSGHYGNECYEDVFCSAVEKGVHPGFALTIWFQETDASNYAAYQRNVLDFGVNIDEYKYNFSRQLDHLLSVIANPTYLVSVKPALITQAKAQWWASGDNNDFLPYINVGNNDDISWATKYVGLKGSEQERVLAGLQYYSKTFRNYRILGGTGDLHFPFNITPDSNACDRSKETTNLMYRDCSGNKTSACSGQDTIPGELDILVGETCTDVGGCECHKGSQYLKDVDCGKECTEADKCYRWTGSACNPFACSAQNVYVNDPTCGGRGVQCYKWNDSKQECYPEMDRNKCQDPTNAYHTNTCGGKTPSTPNPEDPDDPSNPNNQYGPNDPEPSTPDPNVNCSGSDTIPGELDILVGETCTDVSGCECFKGSIQTGNYLKNVACGIKCTDTPPPPEPIDCSIEDKTPGKTDILIGENCEDTGGCRCFYDSKKEENYLKDVACDEICADKSQICCLVDDKLSVKKTSECEGTIMEDIPANSCKVNTFEYKLTRGINFIKAYTTFDSNLEQINTAQGLMKYSLNRVTTIASFKNGEWDKIVEFKDGKVYGTDFRLEPGETYLVIASEDLSLLKTSGYTISPTELDLSKLAGWNLIPTSIFKSKAEKAYNLFGNNNFDPIKQVALWNKDYSMFEYTVENRDGTVTGNDVSLLKQDSVFINIIK